MFSFVLKSILLILYFSLQIQTFVSDRIATMIEEAKKKLTGHPKQPKEPLLRLRITYNEEDQMFNPIRFGQQYKEVVANPSDLILFKKCVKHNKKQQNNLDTKALGEALAQVCFCFVIIKCFD